MENHLKMLEERIAKAITFIENLKTREKSLRDEKDAIRNKVLELESENEDKERTIAELRESQVYLKNRIEAVLSKLESLATLEMEAEQEEDQKEDRSLTDDEADSSVGKMSSREGKHEDATPSTSEGGEIYVEENIVDLKSEDEDDNENVTTPHIAQNPLFDSFINSESTEEDDENQPAKNQSLPEERITYNENNPSLEM
jgi:FtsZ-binding cell division protein ZapB